MTRSNVGPDAATDGPAGQPSKASGPHTIPRGPGNTVHPVSLGQEQIWLHSRLIYDRSAYNEPLTLVHRGPLDAEVLRRTLAEIIRRHEAWRTTFHGVDGEPLAVVHDPPEVGLQVVDLRHLAPDEREREADRLITNEMRRPFDLEAGPLFRFVLFKIDDDLQRLDAAIHQIIFDVVSIRKGFLPELAVIYDDLISGRESSLADPPVQYQDFARWQRATYPEEALAGQLAYWRDQLGEAQPALSLPTDRLRPSVQSYAGGQVTFRLPVTLSRDLRAFSQREGVSLFVALLTTFAVLLARRTGDETQTIGSVTSIRKRPEFESLLGYFLNILALRVDLSDDPPFREALRRARDVVSAGISHDEVPIHRVLQALALQRDSSRSPLFQAMLVLDPPLPDAPIGWELNSRALDVCRLRVDLYVQLEDRPDALIGRMRYPTALFHRTTVEVLVRQWLTLIQAAVAEPDRPIGDLSLLTDGERAALLSARNRVVPTTPFERFAPEQLHQSIAARFTREVADFGGRPAVIEAVRSWTYRELNAAADGVAVAIVTACSTDHPRVGLLGRPGGQLVAAILGILKAGGAYVPLDPQSPARRITSIAIDAQLDLLIVGEGLHGLAWEALGDAVPIVEMAVATAARAVDSIDRAGPGDPAYLLYTSGSTGEPKGTVQSHVNLLHSIRVYTNGLHLSPDDRVLLVAKPTFVSSTMDLFGALLNGAALCVVDLVAVGFLGLRDVIVDRHVTVYHSTPTVYRELVATLSPGERLEEVRAVVLGGEEARAADFDAFRRHFALGSVFVHSWGSTESGPGVLQFFADTTSTIDPAGVPIGYPVEATDAFLLNPYGRPTDFVGEIAIRGRHLALGYWNRPELTAAVFGRDAADPGLVTYRTGDLGRRLADGSLVFAGRHDRQVKVRGMKVDLAEIERVLASLPGVREVALEARPVDSETRLVAYLEASGAERPSQHDLRATLWDKLPEYMVPSTIVWLDQMPRSGSGKIDRLALPPPVVETRATSVAAPRDDLESRLIGIWEQVLSRHPVGVDDDFFDLGGHSLQAVRLVDRIWRETGQRIAPSALLEGATIKRLAARIRDGQDPGRSGLVVLQSAGTQLPLFVVPGAGSRILYLRNLAAHLGPDQPAYALHQPPSGWIGDADHRVEDLARRDVAALRRVQPEGPYHLVGFSFGGAVAYEIAQQLTAAGDNVALLALIDSRNPALPLPAPAFHPRFVARRIANQVRADVAGMGDIIRRLGVRTGARIACDRSLGALHNVLYRRLPARLWPLLWPDPIPRAEREWLAADASAYDRYHPVPYPGRITFLWPEHSQRPKEVFDTRRAWAELALGGFDVRRIPGSHLTVVVEPLVSITAATLVEALREARVGSEARTTPERGDTPGRPPAPGARR